MRKTLLLFVSITFLASRANADLVDLVFSGTITNSTVSAIAIGSSYSGEITYNTDDPIILISAPETLYSLDFPSDGTVIRADGFTVASVGNPLAEAAVFSPLDAFFVGALGGTTDIPGLTPDFINFQIAGPPGLLSSGALPTSLNLNNLSLSGFGLAGTNFDVGFTSGDSFGGTFDPLSFQFVPEPTYAFLGAALLLGLLLVVRLRPSLECAHLRRNQ